MPTILIVDDEENIRLSLKEMLTRDGYQVVAVESGEAALSLIATRRQFDIALIDLKMKGIGGIEVLKALGQQSPSTVTIVLTAHASLESAVEAVRQGAHDYLFKPCKPDELRASIHRGLQRQRLPQQSELLQQLELVTNSLKNIQATVAGQNQIDSSSSVSESTEELAESMTKSERFLQCGGLVIDFLRHIVTLDSHPLDLTPTEFEILAYLAQEAPRVVSPQEIVLEVQGYQSEHWEASETVRQHIYRLRQKIREITEGEVICTVRGVGYTMSEKVKGDL